MHDDNSNMLISAKRESPFLPYQKGPIDRLMKGVIEGLILVQLDRAGLNQAKQTLL